MSADTLGGVWNYALELAGALGRGGSEVVLAAMGGAPSAAQRAEAEALPRLELRVSERRLEWMDDPWDDVARDGAWLLALADEVAPDLVHLNHYAHGALPWRAPRIVVGHSCVLSWWLAVKGEEAPARYDRYAAAVARGLRGADRVVAPSAAMLAELRRLYGPLPPSRVVPNGRTADRFAPAEPEPFVFAAGRLWDEAKNVATLAAIAPRLPWPVRLAGRAERPDGMGRAAVAADGVEALGELSSPALARQLERAAIYALPARYEPFGLSVLEAALAGCALVLGDIPSLRELWSGAARFAPPDDPAALEAQLLDLIARPEERAALALRARRRALRFSAERSARGYLRLYGELLRERAPRHEAVRA